MEKSLFHVPAWMQSARSLGHLLFLLEALYCHIVSLCSVLYKSLTEDSIKVEMYKRLGHLLLWASSYSKPRNLAFKYKEWEYIYIIIRNKWNTPASILCRLYQCDHLYQKGQKKQQAYNVREFKTKPACKTLFFTEFCTMIHWTDLYWLCLRYMPFSQASLTICQFDCRGM